MSNKTKSLRRYLLMFFIVFALIFIRYCYYGFHYYNQLDDYIQFYDLSARGINTLTAMSEMGLFAARPIAALGDTFVWSHFFSQMIIGVLIISAMYAGSAVMLKWVWSRHFGIGYIFLIVYALLPLGFEGIYWMSAASRVVVGMFFASAALVFFEKWCAAGKKYNLILYAVFQLLAYGCYEQVFLFSAASVLLLACLNFKEFRHRSLWGLLTFVNAGLYFLIVSQFPVNSVYKNRMAFIPPWGNYYWNTVLPGVLGQLKSAFISSGFYTIAKGFKRGVILLFTEPNLLYILGILGLSGALFAATKKSDEKINKPLAGLIVGILLTLAPLVIFFVINNSWFSLRGTVTSYCGIAIIADIAIAAAFSRFKSYRTVSACAAVLMALIFCISSISELHDYRKTELKDREIVAVLAEKLHSDGRLHKGLSVGILNVEKSYLADMNYNYHEHVQGVTSSDWALHGALEWYTGDDIPNVAPLPANPMYEPWNSEVMRLGNFDVMYLYDGMNSMVEIKAVPAGDERYELYGLDGAYLGYTWEENKYGYLVLESISG